MMKTYLEAKEELLYNSNSMQNEALYWKDYCIKLSDETPLWEYKLRVLWAKSDCRLFPFCIWTPLKELLRCDCPVEKLKCERCGKECGVNQVVHHKAYCEEAVPNKKNKKWLKYYKLLCSSCHRKEHLEHPELNNRKVWNDIVSRTTGWSDPMWIDKMYLETIRHVKSRGTK